METEGVEEALEQVHAHQNTEGDGPEDWPKNNGNDDGRGEALGLESEDEGLIHEDLS